VLGGIQLVIDKNDRRRPKYQFTTQIAEAAANPIGQNSKHPDFEEAQFLGVLFCPRLEAARGLCPAVAG